MPALAQSDGTLKEVVVTATRSEQLLSATLQHTTVISRQDIERSQASDLVTLLQREAGLQRTQNGGMGTVSSVFMRGAPSLQTLVLIDGVPLNKQDASGAVSLEHLMLDNIERVEIVRGNVSAIYGSGAIGGVIQIFTKTGNSKPQATVAFEAGPRGSNKLSGEFGTSVGATSVSVGVSRVRTDGFSTIDTTQLPTANPDSDSYQNTSGRMSVIHRLSPAHTVGVRYMQSEADTAFDNAFGAPTDLQTARTRLTQTTLFSDNTWGSWRSRLSWSEQSDASNYHDSGSSNDSYTTKARVLNWVNTLLVGDTWQLTAGLEQQRQHVNTASDSVWSPPYSKDRNTLAAFGGLEGKLGQASVQLNLRHDQVGDLNQATGFAGVGYPVTEQIKLTASSSTAFNAPPLGYLFAPGYGNALLKPELARSHELGLQYEQGGQLLRAVYFDTRVRDQLNFGATTFENIGRTRNTGWEMSYRGSLGNSDVYANVTLQDPVNDITGQRLARRGTTLLALGVSQPIGLWRLGADLRYSSDRPDAYSDPTTFANVKTTLAAYSVLDVSLSYKVSTTVLFKARLDNLTAERYQTAYGYNQQPRSLYVGLTWSPQL